ncbi:hypothetical protein J437_LFUL004597, partial [Ladona fulva]
MSAPVINQKEYLKKYLSLGSDEKKKKKRKKAIKSNRVQIVDDDIDLKNMKPLDDSDFNLYELAEDAPQIAGIVDERPEELKALEVFRTSKWKIIQDENGIEDIKVKEEKVAITRRASSSDESVPSICNLIDEKYERNRTEKKAKSRFDEGRPSRRDPDDSDVSPPRKSKPSTDSDESPPRVPRDHRKSPRRDNVSKRRDSPPPRKSKHDTSGKSRADAYDSDVSPPRKYKTKERSQQSPPRKFRVDFDSDVSPPRKSRMKKNANESPPRKSRNRADSDSSPPRKPRARADSDESPPRKSRYKADSDGSPPRRQRRKVDSDGSPPRRTKYAADSDESPPRKRKPREDPGDYRGRPRYPQKPSSGAHSDESPPRKRKPRDDREDSRGRPSYPAKPSTSRGKHEQPPDSGQARRRGQSDSDESPPRKSDMSKRTKPSRWSNIDDEGESSGRHDSKDRKGVNRVGKQEKTLEGKKAGLQDSNALRMENMEHSLREREMFSKMSDELSGRNATTVVRDRATGKKRDIAREEEEKAAEREKENEKKEKYSMWGKGLKQVESLQSQLADDLYEMSKPLARYADDEDLEKHLKEQEREGDPMQEYVRSQK